METVRVGVFAGPLQHMGGGEYNAIFTSQIMFEKYGETTLYSPTNVGAYTRGSVNELQDRTPATIRLIKYNNYISDRFLLSHPLPPVSEMVENDVNLVYVWRLPARSFIREIRRRGVSMALLLHGVTVERTPWRIPTVKVFGLLQRLGLELSRKELCLSSIHFQALNAAVSNQLLRIGIQPKRVHLATLGVDFSKYSVRRNDDTFEILALGRLKDPQKGVSRLRAVIARVLSTGLPDVKFSVIGSGEDEKKVGSFPSNKVFIHGFVSDEQKSVLLSRSAALVVTSNIEPYSFSVVEALASGLPVVTTPVSGPSYIIDHGGPGELGIVNGFGAAHLAEALLKLRSRWESDKQSYFLERVRRRATAKMAFDIERTSIEMVRLVENMLAENPKGEATRRSSML